MQPTYYGTDNALVLDALRRVGERGRGVVRIEDDTPDAELDAMHEAGVRALRLDVFAPLGRQLVETRPDRLLWGSDWPHLPDGQRDTGELLNLLADWAPDEQDRRTILVDGPTRLFWS